MFPWLRQYMCIIRKHRLFGCGGSLAEGGAPLWWFWLVYFCSTSHRVWRTVVISWNTNKPGSCRWRIPTTTQHFHVNNPNSLIRTAEPRLKMKPHVQTTIYLGFASLRGSTRCVVPPFLFFCFLVLWCQRLGKAPFNSGFSGKCCLPYLLLLSCPRWSCSEASLGFQ